MVKHIEPTMKGWAHQIDLTATVQQIDPIKGEDNTSTPQLSYNTQTQPGGIQHNNPTAAITRTKEEYNRSTHPVRNTTY
jgi:hypothetical protein